MHPTDDRDPLDALLFHPDDHTDLRPTIRREGQAVAMVEHRLRQADIHEVREILRPLAPDFDDFGLLHLAVETLIDRMITDAERLGIEVAGYEWEFGYEKPNWTLSDDIDAEVAFAFGWGSEASVFKILLT